MLDAFYKAMIAIGYTHPVHPTQVNMPIGLVVGALILGLAGWILRKSELATAARYCIVIAFVFVFITVAAGVMDWLHYFSGVWLFPIKFKVGLASLLFVLLALAIFLGGRTEGNSILLVGIYALSFFVVVTLGYFGADLVFGGRTVPAKKEFRAGQMVYRLHCEGCHPYGGNEIAPKHPIIASDKLDDFPTFVSWLRNPESPMPSFSPTRLSDQQAQALYDYASHVFTSALRLCKPCLETLMTGNGQRVLGG